MGRNADTWGNADTFSGAGGNWTAGDAISTAVVRGGTNAGDVVTVYGAGQYVYRRDLPAEHAVLDALAQIADLGAGNNPYWLRLKAGPGDDLILGIGTQTGATYAIPYDGNTRTWRAGGALQLDTTGYGDITQNRPFDVLWDPNGGTTNCLAVYSDAGALRYRRSTDGGNSWAAEQTVSASYLAYSGALDAQPDNLVHLAIADSNDRLNTWTWNGTAWTYENQVSTALEYEDSTPLVRPIEPIAITATPALGSLGGTPTTYYRSIGTAADYQNVGSITVTSGSKSVAGTGTGWKTANRGPGDRLTVGGNHYVISLVNSDTTSTLAAAATASTTTSTYTIARQFATLQAWEDCVSFTVACPYFAVSSSSLVADDRSEIGYAYKDSVLTFATSGTPALLIDGSTTDATHSITLTAPNGNRHYGKERTLGSNAATLDNGNVTTGNTAPAISVQDDYVTVEWLEVRGGRGPAATGIEVQNITAGTGATGASGLAVRNNVVHGTGGYGIDIGDKDAVIDVHNNIVYDGLQGIRVSPRTSPPGPGSASSTTRCTTSSTPRSTPRSGAASRNLSSCATTSPPRT